MTQSSMSQVGNVVGVTTVGQQYTFDLQQVAFTHLMFQGRSALASPQAAGAVVLDKWDVSATLYPGKAGEGSVTLIDRVPLNILAEIGDVEAGQSYAENITLGDYDDILTGDAGSNEYRGKLSIAHFLGNLRLDGGDQVKVTLTATTAQLAAERLDISYLNNPGDVSAAERMVATRFIDDQTFRVANILSVYAARRTIAALTDEMSALDGTNATYSISGGQPFKDHVVAIDTAYAATCALGQIAGQGPRRVARLFQDVSGTGRDLVITATGTSVANMGFCGRELVINPARAARKLVEGLKEQEAFTLSIEAGNPGKASALRSMLLIPSSTVLGAALNSRKPTVRRGRFGRRR